MSETVQLESLASACPRVWDELVEQTRTFVTRAGFSDVILGLSGGIDSALVATIAVDAFGAEHVRGLMMPSPFSSSGSVTDAQELARNLRIEASLLPITPLYEAYLATLAPYFEGRERDVTEENIQARIRGNLLMAFSNKFHSFVLATGNRSEALAGYATLYGDMVGGFAPISSLYKTHVFELARWRNSVASSELIPAASIEKEPSAELSNGQLDRHALPAYEQLDAIYYFSVDRGKSREWLIERGFSAIDVDNALERLARFAFKRALAAPGPQLDIYQ